MARKIKFFKSKEERKEEDLKRILGLEGYEKLSKRVTTSSDHWIHITKPIKQSDLRRLFKYYPKFEHLIFDGIDISRLNLSVIPYQQRENSTISFRRTKAGRKTLTKLPTFRMGKLVFEGIDFSESPVRLPTPENLWVDINDCRNLSGIMNIHQIGRELRISDSDVSDIEFYFHTLKSLSISNLRNPKEITRLDQLRCQMPMLTDLDIYDCPKLTEFGNLQNAFPKVNRLWCKRTGLIDIRDFFYKFPCAKRIFLGENKELADITPLMENMFTPPEDIHLDGCSSIDTDMIPVIKCLRGKGVKVDIRETPIEHSRELQSVRQLQTRTLPLHRRIQDKNYKDEKEHE